MIEVLFPLVGWLIDGFVINRGFYQKDMFPNIPILPYIYMYTYIEYSNHCSFFFAALCDTQDAVLHSTHGCQRCPFSRAWSDNGYSPKWRFPKSLGGGTHSYHPFIDWDFPGKTIRELGVPPFMEPPKKILLIEKMMINPWAPSLYLCTTQYGNCTLQVVFIYTH